MYDLIAYGKMVADERRTLAYAEALRRVVRPGAVVLDIGTGTGLLALLACRAGASRVYAIEASPLIQLAREIAAANGFADRMTFVEGMSARISLPEAPDVMVSDLRGVLPLRDDSLVTLIDARDRLLRPGAALIPRHESIVGAVVHAPRTHAIVTGPWGDRPCGFDMSPAARVAHNDLRRLLPDDDEALSDGARWIEIDYATVDSPSFSAPLALRVTREGVAHGLGLWFDATFADGVTFSSAASAGPSVFGRALLPWPAPISCTAGTEVFVDLRADYVGGGYVWTWHTRIAPPDGAGEIRFRQSTLAGPGVSLARLRRRSAQHVPAVGLDAGIEFTVLSLMHDSRSLGDIARALRERFPGAFVDDDAALARAADVAERCGEE